MRKLRWPVALLTLSLVGVSGWMFFVGAQAFTRFLPPRTAVVDISQIFENFQKRKDRAEDLKAAFESLMKERKELKELIEVKEAELKDLKPGSESFKLKYLDHIELSAKLKELEQTRGKEFEEKRSGYLDEIRQEIKAEIAVVAQAEELDLILEKSVSAENPQAGMGFHWAIVHYAKPEFDITKKVTERLNERYQRAGAQR